MPFTIKQVCLFLLITLTAFNPISFAQTKLVFSTVENVPMGKLAENILRKAYESLGSEISIVGYPALRAISTANKGAVDGELIRVEGLEKDYDNLIMIPVPLTTMEGVVFTKRHMIEIEGFESLKPYTISFRRGIKFAEKRTKGMNRIILDSLDHAFLLLKKDRVDFVLTPRLTGLIVLNRLQYSDIKILDPPLVQTRLFHYLHKKHKSLIPKITAMLKTMEKEGLIAKEKEKVIQEILGAKPSEQNP